MNHSAYRKEFVHAFGSCSPNKHDSAGFVCNLSCISFLFFLCSDGLTAGLEWEKDSCLALLLSPLCIFSSLLFRCLLAGWASITGGLGMGQLHFAWLVFSSLPLSFSVSALSFACQERINRSDSRKEDFLCLAPFIAFLC